MPMCSIIVLFLLSLESRSISNMKVVKIVARLGISSRHKIKSPSSLCTLFLPLLSNIAIPIAPCNVLQSSKESLESCVTQLA